MVAPLLHAEQIVKTFPGVTALDGVSFDLRPGEIHALCGENGAGKSTLIKILSGVHPHGRFAGALSLDGQPLRLHTVHDAMKRGISVIYQELALVEEMSVAENLHLGSLPTRWGIVDRKAMIAGARRVLDQFKVRIPPELPVRELGVGQKQLIEIAKALGRQSRILILDEPTAALTQNEVAVLLEILRDLRRRGIACLYVSHKLDEVFSAADRVTVLRDGRSVATLEIAQTNPAEIIKLMVGREIRDLYPRKAGKIGAELLRVKDLTVAPGLRDISFAVHAGEVLGLGGLMGAGRTELLMHLMGAWGRRTQGHVTISGKELAPESPQDALRAGMVMVSEDRQRWGLIPSASVAFNLSLAALKALCTCGVVSGAREQISAAKFRDSLRIKTPHLRTPIDRLSGGNQQKTLLGRALMTGPEVVLLDEPTRGIDVGAKVEVYELINQLTASGKAVVMASSELPELIGMSDRIVMMHEGTVSGEFAGAEAVPERLMAAAMGINS